MKKLEEVRYFADEESVMLYWRKPVYEAGVYTLTLDGKKVGETEKTYYRFAGLEAGKEYQFGISCAESEITMAVFTGAARKRIDVTAAPYHAAGDGKTMNTVALQQAIDDCGVGETVYIPSGTFMTDSLKLHSDMELYLEEGPYCRDG